MPAWQALYDKKGQFTHRPDLNDAEFALYQGVYPGHSGMGYQGLARKSVKAVKSNGLKLTLVDPVMQGGTDIPGGTKWIPVKPATDAAFVLAIMNWMFENEKYNGDFLACPTLEAAEKIGFKSFTNASYLVISDEKHPNYRKFLRAEDIKLEFEPVEGQEPFVVIDKATGKPEIFNKIDTADILFEGEVEGIKVATALAMLRNGANKYSIEEYAKICGVPSSQIIDVAKEFTSHGYKVGVDTLGGTVAINGLPFAVGLLMLPAMLGAFNMKGGMTLGGATYKAHADGPRYNLSTVEGSAGLKGPRISREQFLYENTTEYKNKVAQGKNPYPSKLPWHPNGFNLDGHAIFSAINKYPYQCKILVNCAANPIYGGPSAFNEKVIAELKKTSNIPLFIAIDTVIGETSSFADYIIPDTNFNEHWAILGARGNHTTRITGVRWPVVEPPTQKVGEYNQHISMETYMIEVAKRIGMPGFGDNAVTDANGKKWPIHTREDYWMKAIANMAYDQEPTSPITEIDAKLTGLDSIPKEWEEAITAEELPLVKNIMAKGGKFEPDDSYYDGDYMKYKSPGCICFYSENTAITRNSITGKYHEGSPMWLPEMFANGDLIDEMFPQSEYPFRICSYKPKLRGLSMMSNAPTLQNVGRTNFIEMNSLDAEEYGLADGQEVIIESAANQTKGILKVREGVSRGTLGVCFGYGKWEYGSKDMVIDGKTVAGDSIRGEGTSTNQLGLLDPTVDGVFGLSESTTGSPNRNSIRVKVKPV